MDQLCSAICCLFALTCCFQMISCNITCLPHERDALVAFKNQLHSRPLLHSWKGFNCCEWRAVECSSHTLNVIKLHLANHQRDVEHYYWSSESNGRLVRDLFQLKQLQHLDLSFNYLTGVLPKDLFALQELRHLDLSFNFLEGEIPKHFALQQLRHLDLSSNYFQGEIPNHFALQELRHLDLSFNSFEGEIPKHFASLHNLAYLNLSVAGFNGTIPYQLGNLSQLEYLDLSVADVSDFVTDVNVFVDMYSPSLLWTEKLRKLKYLSLSGVVLNMTGKQLEAPLSHLHNLQHLHLLKCMLSGHIPNAIQNLTSLFHLQLGFNDFEGSMPLWLANMTSLVSLLLHECPLLCGSFPLSFSHLPNLKELMIRGWDAKLLSGNLSQILCGQWSQLTVFSLSGPNMIGSMPPCIGNISSLKYLKLTSMEKMEGPIPSSIGNLSALQNLYLSYNSLNGEIPSSLAQIPSLNQLILHSNMLSGNIP